MVIEISERLLSLFLSDETTPEETYAILKASQTNSDVAFLLDVAEADGFFDSPREQSPN